MKKFLTREEYHEIQKNYKEKNYCPFCDKKNRKEHIIWEGKYWYILHNFSPYSGDHRHIMAVPQEHVILNSDLTDNHLIELREVHKKVKDFFGDENYFSFTRESIIDETRSVEHLHIHFLVGKLQGKYLRKMLENQGYPIKQDLDY